jgi:radical SAM protein with 4Fe4S-binding SPASM domain
MTVKTQDYKDFSKRIHRIAQKKRFPSHAMFELTYRCNFKCVHCYITDEHKKSTPADELNTNEIFNILEQLRDIGCFFLGFTGGEIFLRHDILDIVKHARQLGFAVILLTNGSFIDKETADEIKRLRLNKVEITVHAMNKKIFDKITQSPGSADKVFNTIDILHKRNVPLGIKCCGMQENKDEVAKVSRFARKLNAIYRFSTELTPRQDCSKSPLKQSLPLHEAYILHRICYPEMHNKYDKKGKLRKRAGFKKRNLKRVFNCSAGHTDLTISPFGELKTCIYVSYPKYKILNGSLSEGWDKAKYFVDRLKPPDDWVCRSCDLIDYCSWCPALGYLEDGELTACGSGSRARACFFKQMSEENEEVML